MEVIIFQLLLQGFEVALVEVVLEVPLKIQKRKIILFQRYIFKITIGGGVRGGAGRSRI
jgi:hypothetical protein